MNAIDKYVDSLASDISPAISKEISQFQRQTIDSLDQHILQAFRSIFSRENTSSSSRDDPSFTSTSTPERYGQAAIPFSNQIHLSSLDPNQHLADNNLLSDLLSLVDQQSDHAQKRSTPSTNSNGARSTLSEFASTLSSLFPLQQQQNASNNPLLSGFAQKLQTLAQDPEEKARIISPEMKQNIGSILERYHAPMADKLTRVALDQIKKWLRGNTSSRELGDSLKGEIGNLVSGFSSMLKGNKSSASQAARAAGGDRDQTEKQGGVSGLISRKLSTGLSKVHKDVRIEFRTVLAAVEKDLFEALPGQIQSPLQKILGGNPFDLGNNPQSRDRGVISDKLAESVTRLINKVQSSLRERVLMVVSGGHRRLEAASWGFVQNKVEEKVQRFLPNVKIVIKEGEDGDQKPPPQVGAPTSSGQAGGYPNASPPSFPNPPTSTQGQAQVLAYQQQQQTPAHPPPPLQGMPTQNYGYVNVANLAQPQSGQAHWSGGGTQEQQTPSHHPQGAFPQPWSGPSFDRGFGEGRNLQSEQRETKPSAAASMPNAPMGFGFVGGGGDGGGSGSTYPNQANPARNDDPPPPNANDRGFEIQPTQRFRSSKPRSGARLQDSVVDEWDKDDGGDEEVEEHQTYDPEMEWKRANSTNPQPLPSRSTQNQENYSYVKTLPPGSLGRSIQGGDPNSFDDAAAVAPPRILKRVEGKARVAGAGSDTSTSGGASGWKSLEERQREYRSARERIFGKEAEGETN